MVKCLSQGLRFGALCLTIISYSTVLQCRAFMYLSFSHFLGTTFKSAHILVSYLYSFIPWHIGLCPRLSLLNGNRYRYYFEFPVISEKSGHLQIGFNIICHLAQFCAKRHQLDFSALFVLADLLFSLILSWLKLVDHFT